mmetsp:Transcript_2500/g.6005  ORF Transcript_2500/g.6005 Transcript_2500/m.6005 type:complete len:253 (-) Transcript_2500:1576-2334(-)
MLSQMLLPIPLRSSREKNFPLCLPNVPPRKEASSVYDPRIPSSLCATTRAHPSLPLPTLNEQELKLKPSHSSPTIAGNTRTSKGEPSSSPSLLLPPLDSHPYTKQSSWRECAWRSRKRMAGRPSSCSCRSSPLIAPISGHDIADGFPQQRFMSSPSSDVRQFPAATPSTLTMGTSSNTCSSRSRRARSSCPVRNSRIPCITQLAGVSPGWTREEMKTVFLLLLASSPPVGSVMVTRGHSRCPTVRQREERET